jgi:hypothetical protein
MSETITRIKRMTDEPNIPLTSPDSADLPESWEGDPKSETIISKSAALKRMISAFTNPAENVVDAALDVDRSVDLPKTGPLSEKAVADEKTIFRPPNVESTLASVSSLTKATDEPNAAPVVIEGTSVSTATPPLGGMGQEAARRLEQKADLTAKPVAGAKAEEAAKPAEAAAPPEEMKATEAPKAAETAKKPEISKPVEMPEAPKPDDSRASQLAPAVRPEPKVIDATSIITRQENALTGSPDEAPWTLQQFFNGEIDLDVELSKRFPTMPMLSIVKFRTLGTNSSRRVATLSTQDGAASLIVDADVATKVVQLSFTLGSMLTLRFGVSDLSDMDRNRWVELMRRDQGGLAFLWGPSRWAQDYMICIARKYFTNLYCFSPHNFEAGVRLTPAVTKQLLDWLEELWKATFDADEDSPPLLTW